MSKRHERWRPAYRRHPSSAYAATAVAVAITFGYASWQRTYAFRDLASLWEQTIEANPDALVAHTSLVGISKNYGRAALAREQAERALLAFGRAEAIRPLTPAEKNGKAVMLMTIGRNDQAAKYFEEVCEASGGTIDTIHDANMNLALILVGRHQLEQARDRVKLALAAKPSDLGQYLMGVICQEMGRYQDAESWFREAIKSNERSARFADALGMLLFHEGRIREAIEWCEKAVQLQPTEAYRQNLAIVKAGLH